MLCFLLVCVLSYVLFHQGAYTEMSHGLHAYGYISIFLGGLLFSFGFTTPLAIGLFLALAPEVNPLIATPIAGAGALISDLGIFTFDRLSLHDEIKRLQTTRFFKHIHALLHHSVIPEPVRMYMLWSFADIIVASPLPDEIGLTLLSGIDEIDSRKLAVLCFIFNSAGIAAMLMLGRALAA